MVHDVLATKIGMTQAWTKNGQRVCVTRLHAADVMVVGDRKLADYTIVELGVGQKKLKNTAKPQRSRYEKSGFLVAPRQVHGVRIQGDDAIPAVGSRISVIDLLTVGDVVNVQGVSKGKGFAGVVKRHGFAGGPKTHGQSDRHRAPGSIGNRTTPGRVFKNKRMAGHMGVEVVSVRGLTVVYIDPAKFEVWVSGPVPGSYGSIVKLQKTGSAKGMSLDAKASGTVETQTESESVATEVVEKESIAVTTEETQKVAEEPSETTIKAEAKPAGEVAAEKTENTAEESKPNDTDEVVETIETNKIIETTETVESNEVADAPKTEEIATTVESTEK